MIAPNPFSSFSDCVVQIERDLGVDIPGNLTTRQFLFRGERTWYPKSESSMKRLLTSTAGKTVEAFTYVSPFIDFEDIYAEYLGEKHGLSSEESTGFLQHYGFPTDLIDLTPSIDTARFFACHGGAENSIGVIGVFDVSRIKACFQITDLSNDPLASRPRNQVAFVARPNRGFHDLKGTTCTSACVPRWYCFNRNKEDLNWVREREGLIYPDERELKRFFARDLDAFFLDHINSRELNTGERARILERLDLIRSGLGNTEPGSTATPKGL